VFRIDMLPANYGDCLWIEYGDPQRPHRILVDGGTPKTIHALEARIRSVVEREGACRFELIVITHVDVDHIGGALKLVERHDEIGATFDDIWFNGYRHLVQARIAAETPRDALGVRDGEKLTTLLENGLPWNVAFGNGPIVVPDDELPVKTLPGGMTITLLSPTAAMLRRLEKQVWEKIVDDETQRLVEEEAESLAKDVLGEDEPDVEALFAPTPPDRAPANGSSIAFLAEFGGKRLLLGADAYAEVLLESLGRLGARLRVDAFKLPHHGSAGNVSTELLEAIDCNTFLVSTSGVSFGHPDPEAIARAIKAGGAGTSLYFNYDSPFTSVWNQVNVKMAYDYTPYYGEAGSRVTLLP
jgi:beta-lactamase superfamily II metal-dependent hydrolase